VVEGEVDIDQGFFQKLTEKRPVKRRTGLGAIGSLKGSPGEGNMNRPDETEAISPGSGGGAVEREPGMIAVRGLPKQKCLPKEGVRGEGGLGRLVDFRQRREDEVFLFFRRKERSMENESRHPRRAGGNPGAGTFMKTGGGIGKLTKDKGHTLRPKRKVKAPKEGSPEMGGGGPFAFDPMTI
jgi:hypothetical protein